MKTYSLLIALLIPLFAASACKRQDSHAGHNHAPAEGGHTHTAPHGGVLVELGDHAFNLEFVVQPEAGRLMVYLLSGHADQFVRSNMPSMELAIMDGAEARTLVLQPMANVITGETVGNTSLFAAEAEWLKKGTPFTGQVRSVSLGGARFQSIPFAYSGTVR
jgi:hypothetical protein